MDLNRGAPPPPSQESNNCSNRQRPLTEIKSVRSMSSLFSALLLLLPQFPGTQCPFSKPCGWTRNDCISICQPFKKMQFFSRLKVVNIPLTFLYSLSPLSQTPALNPSQRDFPPIASLCLAPWFPHSKLPVSQFQWHVQGVLFVAVVCHFPLKLFAPLLYPLKYMTCKFLLLTRVLRMTTLPLKNWNQHPLRPSNWSKTQQGDITSKIAPKKKLQHLPPSNWIKTV